MFPLLEALLKRYLREPLQDLTKSLLLGRFLDQPGLAEGGISLADTTPPGHSVHHHGQEGRDTAATSSTSFHTLLLPSSGPSMLSFHGPH